MIDRIKEILEKRNLPPSRFADKIGVPRSTISHILSGRNNPSLEVVQKILNAFPDIPVEWLLQGKGSLSPQSYTLFGSDHSEDEIIRTPVSENHKEKNEPSEDHEKINIEHAIKESDTERVNQGSLKMDKKLPLTVEKVIIFYNNGTFKEYIPSI